MKLFIPVIDSHDSPERDATVAIYSVLKDQEKEQTGIAKKAIPQAKVTKGRRRKYSREKRASGIIHQPYAHFAVAPPQTLKYPGSPQPLTKWTTALQDVIHFNASLAKSAGILQKDEAVEPILFYHGRQVAKYLVNLDEKMLPGVTKIGLPSLDNISEVPSYPKDSPLHKCADHPILAVLMPSFADQEESNNAACQLFSLIKARHKKHSDTHNVLIKTRHTTKDTMHIMSNLMFAADVGDYPSIDDMDLPDILPALTVRNDSMLLMVDESTDALAEAVRLLPPQKITVLDADAEAAQHKAMEFYYESGLITRALPNGKISKPKKLSQNIPAAAMMAHHLIDALVPVF